MTTPNGNILFNVDEGSDTQASGLGPATALYGSTASITTSSNVVTGIDTTGVTAGDLLWVQSSGGLQFNIIASVDSSSQVTCDNLYQVTETGRNWAIGGKRQTIDNSDSRRLLGEFNVQDLPAGAWVELETDQTVTSQIQGRGSRRIKSSEGSKKKITFDFVAADGEYCLSGGGVFQSLIFETVYSNLTFGRASTGGYQSHNQSYFYDCVLKNFFAFGVGFSRLFTAYLYRCRVEDVYVRNAVYNFAQNYINGSNCEMYVESCLFKNCGIFNDSRSVLENSIFIGSGNHEFCIGTAPRVRNSIIYNYTNAITGTTNQYENGGYQRYYSDSTFQGNIFHTISSDLINLSSSSLEFYRFEVLDNLFYNVNQFCNISGVEELISDNNVTLLGDPFVDIANEDFNLNEAGNTGNLARHRKVDLAASTDERSISLSTPVGLGDEVLWLCPTFDSETLDLSGNGNHGTYNGGMTTVPDTSNGGKRAYSFDGVDDYISTGNDVSANSTRSFSCWVYLDTQASRTFVASCYTSGTSTSQMKVAIGINSSLQPYAVIQNGGAIANAQSSSALSTSQWYHIAGVFTSGSTKVADLYVDGVLDTTGSGTGSFPPLDETLVGVTARSNGALIAFMDGLQDDIRIFDRVLTEHEIGHISKYRGITGSPITYEGLGGEVLWLCPTLHNSPRDLSGNDHHGTYNGGMSTVEDTDEGGLRAYSFNGVNQAISLTSTTIQQITTECSFSAWVYLDSSVTSGFRTIFDRSTLWTPGTISLSYSASFDRLEFVTNTNGDDGFARYTITPANFTNKWWHVCGVLSGGNVTLYLNGEQVAQDSTDTVPTTSTGQFVGATGTTQNEWIGKIDDLRVFTKPLIVQEIAHLASKRGVLGRPQ